MKRTVLAQYQRKSTLWRNANAFYKSQDWTIMECVKYDYSEEMEEEEFRWIDPQTGEDVTDKQKEHLYGKPYVVALYTTNKRNSRTFCFDTADKANECVKGILHHKILSGWQKKKGR